MPIDFGPTSSDYATHRVEFSPALYERLRQFGIGRPGQRLLDLGGGTGLFSASIEAEVSLVDASHGLLRQSAGPRRIVGLAEVLPLADESFDIVAAAQCWHWFDRDLAPREILRVLQPGGLLVAVYQTYIPTPGSVAEATEQLILKHRPGWRHANSTGINGQVLRDMQSAGFLGIESFSFDLDVKFSHEGWRGFIRTTSPIGASMSPAQMEEFDREHAELLKGWPIEPLIPHRVFAAIARKPSHRI